MSSPLLIVHGSKAWTIAFVAALSESKLYEDLARYAGERARLVQRFRAVGDGYVDDLVQDAIDDCSGIRATANHAPMLVC